MYKLICPNCRTISSYRVQITKIKHQNHKNVADARIICEKCGDVCGSGKIQFTSFGKKATHAKQVECACGSQLINILVYSDNTSDDKPLVLVELTCKRCHDICGFGEIVLLGDLVKHKVSSVIRKDHETRIGRSPNGRFWGSLTPGMAEDNYDDESSPDIN